MNEEKHNSSPLDERKLILKALADRPLMPLPDAVFLIREYIFDHKGVRPNLDISDTERFEKAATVACNYYAFYTS
jgi:hypothetical protein